MLSADKRNPALATKTPAFTAFALPRFGLGMRMLCETRYPAALLKRRRPWLANMRTIGSEEIMQMNAPCNVGGRRQRRHDGTLKRAAIGVLIACVAWVGTSARAANTRTWNGGGAGNNWGTSANWGSTGTPITDDALVFQGSTGLSPYNNIVNGTLSRVGNLAISATGFSISGNPLELGANWTLGTKNTSVIATWAINSTLYQNISITAANSGSTLTFSGTLDNKANTLTLPGAGNVTFSGAISGSGGLTMTSSGTTMLSTANSYSGLTTITAGTLKLGAANAIPRLTGFTENYMDCIGGVLDLNGYALSCNTLSGYATVTSSSGSPVLTVGSSEAAYGGSGFSGSITGPVALTKDGTSLFYLAGGSGGTYSGDTTISAGTLQMRATEWLPFGLGVGNLSISTGATLDLRGSDTQVNGLSGAGKVSNNSDATDALFTVGNNDASSTFSGAIDDSGGTYEVALTKTGAGVLTLSGANNYRGDTTVSAGTLVVNGSLGSGSGAAVSAGGTLSGSGTVGASITVADDARAVLYPHSSSTLTVGGNIAVAANSTTKFDLSTSTASGNDKVVMENTILTITGSPQVTINPIGTSLSTADYVLFAVGASGTIWGSFNTVPNWTTPPPFSAGYTVTTVGNTVVLHYTTIPLTVTAASNSKTYDGNMSAAAAPTITSGTLDAGDTGVFSESYNTPNVGSGMALTPTGTIKDAGNNDVTSRYNITWTAANVGTITAAIIPITLSGSRIYNGSATALASILTIVNNLDGGNLTLSGTANLASKQVGAQAVSAGTLALGGTAAGKYTLVGLSGSVTITVKDASLTGLGVSDKFYDGTTAATLTGTAAITSGDIVSGDVVSLVSGVTPTGAFVDRELGNAKSVPYASGFTLSGADASNYYLVLQSLTASIVNHKEDSGTTTNTSANSLSFGLSLNNGKMLADNDPTGGSINGAGTISVNANAILGGTGKVGGVAVNSGGTVAPGDSVGVLNSGSETWGTSVTTSIVLPSFGTINPVGGTLTDRFNVVDGLHGLMFADQEENWGPTLFYSTRWAESGLDPFETISTIAPSVGVVSDRFALSATNYDALTLAAPDVGYGVVNFYYVRHDDSGVSTFGVIKPAGASTSADLWVIPGTGYKALAFAAADLGYGAKLFYFLRQDANGLSTFGTINPTPGGIVTDLYTVGTNFDSLVFMPGAVSSWGAGNFAFLRHDAIGSTLGTLDPVTHAVTDRVSLGANFVNALTFAATDVGYGPNLLYYLRPATPWNINGGYAFQMRSATGTAGTDWDLLSITGNLNIAATISSAFTVKVYTLNGAVPGQAANFNTNLAYQWPIATVSGSITSFDPTKFIVDASQFQNAAGSGKFSVKLSSDQKSVNLVFTPSCAVNLTASTYVLGTDGKVHMYFSNPFGLNTDGGLEAMILNNCTITAATAYGPGFDSGLTIGGLPLTVVGQSTSISAGATRLEVVATKINGSQSATVNVEVRDACGGQGNFDPVFIELKVQQGGVVRQSFSDLPAAEHYVGIVNGTPGLAWVSILVNGQVFALNPLADGQSVLLDLGAAMGEGDTNLVVLAGQGVAGASASITIGDLSVVTGAFTPATVVTGTEAQHWTSLAMAAANPVLQITQNGANLVLSWSDMWDGFSVQTRASMAPEDSWVPVVVAPVLANGQFTAAVPVSSGMCFRLSNP